ncbi:LysM peptidoglycan-binding domain-containing protein [Peribacillus sp. B-H-3]|uniref:LysM peptidoglycan-binding domain-containing protein n=1 Tax=Peribacillus sp. B-H-3 TaxID=3400420 RepID=UPI003B0204F6
MGIHVVKAGDTLFEIAKKYRTDTAEIRTLNGLPSGDEIIPGLALYIPASKVEDRIYKVKQGDVLGEIAARFDVRIPAILKANPGLKPDVIKIGQLLKIPTRYKLRLKTLSFSFPANGGEVFSALEKSAEQLTYLAIVAYSFTKEGYVYIIGNDSSMIAKSKQLGVMPLLMIRNFLNDEFSPELAGGVLDNTEYRQRLVRSIMSYVAEKGYAGVSMDIEFVPPASRANYVLLLRELKKALGRLVLQVNVHAKTGNIPNNRIVGGHDYEEIGKIADITAVMTIDYGYPTGPPNPISPIWWMKDVLNYAVSKIPARKLLTAFPLYSYDWEIPSNKTAASSMLRAQNRAIEEKSDIHYDLKAASPWYQYWPKKKQHDVWYEDIRSITAKYQLMDEYEIAGTTFWRLGLEFPQNDAYIKQNILVLKS